MKMPKLLHTYIVTYMRAKVDNDYEGVSTSISQTGYRVKDSETSSKLQDETLEFHNSSRKDSLKCESILIVNLQLINISLSFK